MTGAVYLDAGLGKARDVLLASLSSEIEKTSQEGFVKDFKSALQEFVQKKNGGFRHIALSASPAQSIKKMFNMEVVIRDRGTAWGRGANKKEAEQAAAKVALSAGLPSRTAR